MNNNPLSDAGPRIAIFFTEGSLLFVLGSFFGFAGESGPVADVSLVILPAFTTSRIKPGSAAQKSHATGVL